LEQGLIPNDFQVVFGEDRAFDSPSWPSSTLCVSTGQILCLMNNPFNKGDKVSIKIKGQAVEAWVTQTWNQEVQVRTGDNKLIWRVAKTVTLVEAANPTTESLSGPIQASATTHLPAQPETTEAPKPVLNNAATKSKPDAKQIKGTSATKKQPAKSIPYKRSRSQGNRRKKI
jgi:hypothetical protein